MLKRGKTQVASKRLQIDLDIEIYLKKVQIDSAIDQNLWIKPVIKRGKNNKKLACQLARSQV